ncbi:MAG: sugar ABC transporter permease [Lachnospiraceae bacterium]|nr:sugar ABC transporter permease [Lachnospiraceae bacterium]
MLKKRRKFFYLFVFPGFVGIVIFVLLPFGDVVRRSFTTAVTGQFNGLKNYRTIFQNQAFMLAVGNTVKFTLAGIPLLVLTGFVTALLLNTLKNKRWVKSIYLFPLAMPTATIVMVWKIVFYKQGFLNLLLTRLGQWSGMWGEVHKDYLGTSAAFWVLVGSYIWKNMGYTVVLWLAGLMGIPAELLEAARVDGAGKWKSLRYIVLPCLKGSLYTIVILSFLNSFKIYREAYLTAGAYPDKSIYLLQHLFNNWFVNLELDKMAAAAVCTGGVLLIAILGLQRLWDKDAV